MPVSNARYVNEENSVIAVDLNRDGQIDVLFVPVDINNAHYREILALALPIAAFSDPGRLARAKRAKFLELREEGMDRLFMTAQTADTIRAAARPVALAIQAATTVAEVRAIDATAW